MPQYVIPALISAAFSVGAAHIKAKAADKQRAQAAELQKKRLDVVAADRKIAEARTKALQRKEARINKSASINAMAGLGLTPGGFVATAADSELAGTEAFGSSGSRLADAADDISREQIDLSGKSTYNTEVGEAAVTGLGGIASAAYAGP